jgi:AcrR family transcriptional regulator
MGFVGRGRPQLHSQEAILDAARDLVLDGGARAATVNAIAQASGAPKGSIYHRFASLNDLLAAMWIRAVRRSQNEFIAALAEADAISAAIGAGLSICEFAQRHPADARLLASLRRADLIQSVTTPRLRRELAELNQPLQQTLIELARRLFGGATPDELERTVFAVVDLPLGATRRHLIAGTPLPHATRDQLAAAIRAALLQGRPTTPTNQAGRPKPDPLRPPGLRAPPIRRDETVGTQRAAQQH